MANYVLRAWFLPRAAVQPSFAMSFARLSPIAGRNSAQVLDVVNPDPGREISISTTTAGHREYSDGVTYSTRLSPRGAEEHPRSRPPTGHMVPLVYECLLLSCSRGVCECGTTTYGVLFTHY
jgi:hypothetical protein